MRCIRCKVESTDFTRITKVMNKLCNPCSKTAKKSYNRMCTHGIRLSKCLECEGGGNEICAHERQKHNCRDCRDPFKIRVKQMVFQSRQTDVKRNRYDPINIVDREHVANLLNESEMICNYCGIDMCLDQKYASNLATIDRIDNRLGHIKGNCTISCFQCNVRRVGDQIFGAYLDPPI